ncbi:MAG: hypothetical protein AABX33_02705 [Nanoarchaeota archaeon]
MQNQKLIQLVNDAFNKGHSAEQVKSALMKKGLSPSYADWVIAWASKTDSQVTFAGQSLPRKHGIWWIGLIVVLIVAAGFIFFYFGEPDFKVSEEPSLSIEQQIPPSEQSAQQNQNEVVRNLERTSGTMKDLGGTF